MKSNEQKSPVDDYFRQHEADIPVAYDPLDWSRLTALLDAPQEEELPKTPVSAPRRSRFRGGKGWWAPGVWLLTLATVSWVIWQTAGNGISEKGSAMPGVPETTTDMRPAAPEDDLQPGAGGYSGKSKTSPAASDRAEMGDDQAPVNIPAQPESGSILFRDSTGTIFLSTDDSLLSRALPVSPADSVAVDPKVVKKKKFLFW